MASRQELKSLRQRLSETLRLRAGTSRDKFRGPFRSDNEATTSGTVPNFRFTKTILKYLPLVGVFASLENLISNLGRVLAYLSGMSLISLQKRATFTKCLTTEAHSKPQTRFDTSLATTITHGIQDNVSLVTTSSVHLNQIVEQNQILSSKRAR